MSKPSSDYTYDFMTRADWDEMYADDGDEIDWLSLDNDCDCGSGKPMEACCGYE